MVSFTRSDGGRTDYKTGLTTWSIWDQPTQLGDRMMPAGCVGMVKEGGSVLVDAAAPPLMSANDPSCGGLGFVGWHHYRDVPGANIWDKGGDLHLRRVGGFGVESSLCSSKPALKDGAIWSGYSQTIRDNWGTVARVDHAYRFSGSGMQSWITLAMLPTDGPAVYVKEPKVTVGIAAHYDKLTVSAGNGDLLTSVLLPNLTDPAKATRQLPQDLRHTLTFTGDSPSLSVVAAGAVRQYQPRQVWENASCGFDRWAQIANTQTPLKPISASYCRQGGNNTLSRKWEVAKRSSSPKVQVMLHAWEGGTGYPDCLDCFLRWLPGQSFTAYVSARVGAQALK